MTIKEGLVERFKQLLERQEEIESTTTKNELASDTFARDWIKSTVQPLFSELTQAIRYKMGDRQTVLGFGKQRPKKQIAHERYEPNKTNPPVDHSKFWVVFYRDDELEFEYSLEVRGRPYGVEITRTHTSAGVSSPEIAIWRPGHSRTVPDDQLLEDFYIAYSNFLEEKNAALDKPAD